VMHEAKLRHITGVNGTPQDLTKKELTKLTVTENGVQAPVCSLDSYLEKPHKLNQKLHIEIKTSKKQSHVHVERFVH
ncbi:glycerophosphodiester phosphodiesterase, partial [Enterococcus faecium]